MQNILPLDGLDNIGNIYQFRFIPVVDVESIPDPSPFAIQSPLVPVTGKDWYMGAFTQETCDYKQTAVDSANGPFHKFNLSCIVPLIRKSMTQNFTEMLDHRFVLDVYDMNGNRKLVGSKEDGCKFIFEESPTTGAGRNGYVISFYAESIVIYNYEDNDSDPTGGGGSGGS